MSKEQIYDDQIAPLMAQVIDVCTRHGIAMLATYAIPSDEDDGLRCTSHLPDEKGVYVFREAAKIVKPQDAAPMMMLTTRDKDGNVVSMTAIV